MEKTLVILKPGCISRGLIGEIVSRFEKKGLRLAGMKMIQLNEAILNEHYAHLVDRPFFARIKDGMMATPVIVCCWEGIDVIRVAHDMAGKTNGRDAIPGTIRGDYSMSVQENIVHTSDSLEAAEKEIKRFFLDTELHDYQLPYLHSIYCSDELE